jgi:dipeptidyl aminopeptidase/acylaminoacyl peptidase
VKRLPDLSTSFSVVALSLFAAGSFALASAQSGQSAPATVPGSNGLIAYNTAESVIVAREDGSARKLVGDGAAPAWSPEGRRLAVFRRTAGPCAPCNYALDVLDVETARRSTIFEGTTFDPAPAWSPDGRRIALVNQRAKVGDDEIWVIDANGSNARQLTTTDDNFAPAWSPDGSRIAFYGFGRDGVHLYSIGADGSNLRQLTFGAGINTRPSWSPDGTRIAFLSSRSGSFEIYVMNSDGSGVRPVAPGSGPRLCTTPCPFPYANPSWSPDGGRVVFASDRDGQWRLYVVPAAGGTAMALLTEPGAIDPDWQPTVEIGFRAVVPPTRLRAGQIGTIRLDVANTGARDATALVLSVTTSRHISLASEPRVEPTLRAGASTQVRVRVRAQRFGRAFIRVTVRAAEADRTPNDNSATRRMRILGRPKR